MATTQRIVDAVAYDRDHSRIKDLRVTLVGGDGAPLFRPMVISRENVIRDIEKGDPFNAGQFGPDGNLFALGEKVRYTTAGYLRTDPNDVEEDNLGALPEFTPPIAIEHR